MHRRVTLGLLALFISGCGAGGTTTVTRTVTSSVAATRHAQPTSATVEVAATSQAAAVTTAVAKTAPAKVGCRAINAAILQFEAAARQSAAPLGYANTALDATNVGSVLSAQAAETAGRTASPKLLDASNAWVNLSQAITGGRRGVIIAAERAVGRADAQLVTYCPLPTRTTKRARAAAGSSRQSVEAAVARAAGFVPSCATVRVSRVNPGWALVSSSASTPESCDPGNGFTIVHRVLGHWREIYSGSVPANCPYQGLSEAIGRSLGQEVCAEVPIPAQTTTSTVASQPVHELPAPDPAVCQELYDEWQAGGGDSSSPSGNPAAQAAIEEYGQIGCGQSPRTDGNTWCKNFTGDGQVQAICDFRPHTPGAYPPQG